jgi:hypothetical protein
MNLWNLHAYLVDGFAFAAESLVGRALGSGDAGALRASVRRLMGWGLGLSALVVAGYAAFRDPLLGIFTDKPAVLAGCRAVFCTAGNQLISEAIHFGKPVLALPEDALEQRLNARTVERWQIGLQTRRGQVTAELLRRFLARADDFAANVRARRRDGLAEAIAAIEAAIEQLASARRPRGGGAAARPGARRCEAGPRR